MVRITLEGDWELSGDVADRTLTGDSLSAQDKRLEFDAHDLGRWDSALVLFVDEVVKQAIHRGIEVDFNGLPGGVERFPS